jgi:lipopolysaccharide heptosyltransferase II
MTNTSDGKGARSEVESRTWEAAQNLLCVRLDSLGDVLMSTPAIRALKEAQPGRRVTLLTSPSGSAAATLVPEIDEVIVYDAPWMKPGAPAGPPLEDMGSGVAAAREYAMVERLRNSNFDAAIIFTVYSQNPLPAAFLCYLAGIPLRLAHCRENPYQLLTNWVKDVEPGQDIRHEVRRQLDLVATVDAKVADERISVHVPEDAAEKIAGIVTAAGLDLDRPWFVLHPGATAASRRYPPHQYAVVVRRLIEESGAQAVLTGSTGEIELIDEIRSRAHSDGRPSDARVISLAGLLELTELAALLQLAPVLISNNTGPVHVAAGLGTPTVVLYALTNPQHTPWLTPSKVLFHDVPCKFCYKSTCPLEHNNCLRLVAPNRVVNAALGFLRSHRNTRAYSVGAQAETERAGRYSPQGIQDELLAMDEKDAKRVPEEAP